MPKPGQKYGDVTFDQAFLRQNYLKWDDWLALREKMDPQQVFVTDYWRKFFNITSPALSPDKYSTQYSGTFYGVPKSPDLTHENDEKRNTHSPKFQ